MLYSDILYCVVNETILLPDCCDARHSHSDSTWWRK